MHCQPSHSTVQHSVELQPAARFDNWKDGKNANGKHGNGKNANGKGNSLVTTGAD